MLHFLTTTVLKQNDWHYGTILQSAVKQLNKRNPKKKILFFQMRTIISWSYNAENFFWMQKGILPSE